VPRNGSGNIYSATETQYTRSVQGQKMEGIVSVYISGKWMEMCLFPFPEKQMEMCPFLFQKYRKDCVRSCFRNIGRNVSVTISGKTERIVPVPVSEISEGNMSISGSGKWKEL
jgi:hypothetical protein